MYFAWKDEYCINIEEIDNQHKRLFEIGREVSNLLFTTDSTFSQEDISSIFNKLKDYTVYHFKFEENLMREHGYLYYEIHKNEHDLVIERIHKLENKYEGTLQKESLKELINLIFDWILKHILKSDVKLKEYQIYK